MYDWFGQFRASNSQTKYFILNWAVYGIAIILSTIYAYARLDYVRSYKTPPTTQESQEKPKG